MTTYSRSSPPAVRFKLRVVDGAGGLSDHRGQERKSEYLTGALVLLPGGTPIPCMLRDCSGGGGRFEIERDKARPGLTAADLPSRISIHFCPSQTEVEARVVWRDGRHFGVRYIGVPQPAHGQDAAR